MKKHNNKAASRYLSRFRRTSKNCIDKTVNSIDLNSQSNSNLNFRFCLSKQFLMSLSALLVSFSTVNVSYGGLSAMTASTIEGSEPYLLLSDGVTTLTSLNELAGFSMWDGTYELDGVTKHLRQVDVSMAATPISVPVGFVFNDVHALVPATGTSQLVVGLISVGDDDGDAIDGLGTAAGSIKVEWKNNGNTIPLGSQNQMLSECGSGGLYTLSITVDTPVSANTAYGVPRTKIYGTNPTVTYTFLSSNPGICYIQPKNMQTYTGTAGDDIKYAAGYNSAVWEYDSATTTHKGFKKSAGFPTIGFDKAAFSVIGSGNDQSNYRCRKTGSWVSLSADAATSALGEGCLVTYNSVAKPTTPVTIHLDYFDGSSWLPNIDSYTIEEPTKWARVKQLEQYNTGYFIGVYSAAVLCGAPSTTGLTSSNMTTISNYFFKLNELTNAPQADSGYVSYNSDATWTTVKTPTLGGQFSRDVDGTLTGEWGNLYNDYNGSGFVATHNSIWAAETYSQYWQFYVNSDNGYVGAADPAALYLTVCR